LNGEHNNKTIITFDPSCSNTSNLKYSFYNTPTDFCANLDVESKSISVLFVNCNDKKEDNSIWIIILVVVLGSIIVIVIGLLLVVLLVPSIKKKVFPYSNRKNIKEKVQKKN